MPGGSKRRTHSRQKRSRTTEEGDRRSRSPSNAEGGESSSRRRHKSHTQTHEAAAPVSGYRGVEVVDDMELAVPGIPRGERTHLPVSISVSDPSSLVLLLSSPEDYVFHMAAMALGAYAELSPDNTAALLALDALPAVVARLEKALDDPDNGQGVYAAAAFLLSVCLRERNGRKQFIKLGGVPSLVALLEADDVATLEAATLALAALSRDFAVAGLIVGAGAMPHLLNLAQLDDQDLAYYATLVIGNCAAEYSSRVELNAQDGIPVLLSLLAATSPNLRLAAARAMARVVKEFANRVKLRVIDGIPLVLQFLADPSLAFLAPYLASIVASCVEERGTLEAFESLNLIEVLITALASSSQIDTLAQVALALARSCVHPPARDAVLHHDAFGSVVIRLLADSDDATILAHLAQLVLNLASSSPNCSFMRELDTIPVLVSLLRHSDAAVHATALAALAAFALHYENRSAIRAADGLPALVEVLSDGTESIDVSRNAADAITSLCQEHESRVILRHLGLIPLLLSSLGSAVDRELKAALARAVAGIGHDDVARDELTQQEAVDILVPLLSDTSASVRQDAAWAISVCCAHEQFAQQVCNRGGIDQLQSLVQGSGSDRERANDTLAQLLRKNYSAKYALTSKLGREDVIAPGFYDMGRARSFLPLAHLAAAKLNSKRETLLFDPEQDAVIASLVARAKETITTHPEKEARIAALAELVSSTMGGAKDWISYNEFGEYEYELAALKVEHKSNVLPLGAITKGVFYHRALLFKILADAAKIAATLERGEYTRAWNVVRINRVLCVVDLIFAVGSLYPVGREKAQRYTRL